MLGRQLGSGTCICTLLRTHKNVENYHILAPKNRGNRKNTYYKPNIGEAVDLSLVPWPGFLNTM